MYFHVPPSMWTVVTKYRGLSGSETVEMSHSSRGWEAQDQDPERFGVY